MNNNNSFICNCKCINIYFTYIFLSYIHVYVYYMYICVCIYTYMYCICIIHLQPYNRHRENMLIDINIISRYFEGRLKIRLYKHAQFWIYIHNRSDMQVYLFNAFSLIILYITQLFYTLCTKYIHLYKYTPITIIFHSHYPLLDIFHNNKNLIFDA